MGIANPTGPNGGPTPKPSGPKAESHEKPSYYRGGALPKDMQVIDAMRKIWGDDAVVSFCELNSFKYRMRAGRKGISTVEQDMSKAAEYERLKEKIVSGA